LRFNSSGIASFCQFIQRRPKAGDLYELKFRARSANGQPIEALGVLWEIRDAQYGASWNVPQEFVATTDWQEYTVSACARNGEATMLVPEFYIRGSSERQNLDIDAVTVKVTNPSVCSPRS
jgi:hypothetical protein